MILTEQNGSSVGEKTCLVRLCSLYRGADKSLARSTSRCILFVGENISFYTSLVIYIYIFSWRDSPLVGLGLLIHEVFSRSHTTTHHSR